MIKTIFEKGVKKSISTIAFYNVENLFDTIDSSFTRDESFTPSGKMRWTERRYHKKLERLGSVISSLGINRAKIPPIIVGLVEVENKKVVNDLANSKYLKKYDYEVVHHDSPDERGIDVAMLYNKVGFEYIDSTTFPVFLTDELGERDYTRDILKVSGYLHGKLTHILINHWSSRREGVEKTEHKRITAAKTLRKIIENIYEKESSPKIIIMGDFNDNPTSPSIKEHLVKDDLFNPMEKLFDTNKSGSIKHKGKWYLFDQIIFSKNFLQAEKEDFSFYYAAIFNKKWLKIFKGKFKGNPFRTYIGRWYKGGFSDHFPVYAFLKKEE